MTSSPEPRDVARIRAELDAGLPEDEVLGPLGLSREAFFEAEAKTLASLARGASAGKLGDCAHFVALVDGARRKAAAEARTKRRPETAACVETNPAPDLPIPALPVSSPPRAQPSPLAAPDSHPPITAPVASAMAKKPPLPFAAPTPTRPPPPPQKETIAMPAFTEESAPDSDGLPFVKKTTSDLPIPLEDDPLMRTMVADPNAGKREVMPFHERMGPSPEARARASQITLATYARLCADLRKYPRHMAEIRAHYKLDQETFDALHRIWGERFTEDPRLRERWNALVAQHMGKS